MSHNRKSTGQGHLPDEQLSWAPLLLDEMYAQVHPTQCLRGFLTIQIGVNVVASVMEGKENGCSCGGGGGVRMTSSDCAEGVVRTSHLLNTFPVCDSVVGSGNKMMSKTRYLGP